LYTPCTVPDCATTPLAIWTWLEKFAAEYDSGAVVSGEQLKAIVAEHRELVAARTEMAHQLFKFERPEDGSCPAS
jgi:hypothetical protein